MSCRTSPCESFLSLCFSILLAWMHSEEEAAFVVSSELANQNWSLHFIFCCASRQERLVTLSLNACCPVALLLAGTTTCMMCAGLSNHSRQRWRLSGALSSTQATGEIGWVGLIFILMSVQESNHSRQRWRPSGALLSMQATGEIGGM